MCETTIINRSLVGLSRRSFNRRIDIINTSLSREKSALGRLNRELDKLYETIYDAYPSITETEYRQIEPFINILLDTLQDLIKAYQHSEYKVSLAESISSLRSNFSALHEINADIVNFKIEIHKNGRFQKVMDRIRDLSEQYATEAENGELVEYPL